MFYIFYATTLATAYDQRPKFVRAEHLATAEGENCDYGPTLQLPMWFCIPLVQTLFLPIQLLHPWLICDICSYMSLSVYLGPGIYSRMRKHFLNCQVGVPKSDTSSVCLPHLPIHLHWWHFFFCHIKGKGVSKKKALPFSKSGVDISTIK